MKGNIWVQAIGFVGTALYFVSYQCRKNRTLFAVQFLSYLFYTIHLFLLGANAGAISYILNIVRSLCLASGNKFLKSKQMCVIICVLQAVSLTVTWTGPLALLPVTANIASTIGGYTDDAKKIRFAGMFINSPLWIIYDVMVGSYAGILDEVVSEISMIISMVRYGRKAVKEEENKSET